MPGTPRSPASRRSRRHAAAVLALLGVAAVAIGTALSWHFSSRVIVPDHSPWATDVEIVGVAESRIELERAEATEQPGVYGLTWEGGHAILGPIVATSDETVTRRISAVRGYLTTDTDAGIDGQVYVGDPGQSLGLPYREVVVDGELGPLPAWLVPGRERTWAIVVHGHNGSRQDGLEVTPALHRLGLPALLVSYRNDPGVDPSPDGYHHLGLTEWRDVDAAARWALRHGARRLVLVGISMGGAIVGRFMADSPRADRVTALVLDAPVVDWSETLEFNSAEMGLPEIVSLPLRWAIDARADVDWNALDYESHPEDFELPILLFHGADDGLVPVQSSQEVARAWRRRVTYVEVPDADHVQAWNVDSSLYERRLTRFLLATLPGLRSGPGRAAMAEDTGR
ncbi:MAG TPA: prolyl oligopeptidase family serine peptidase [Solirubrobacterales bacterium]|nr:prolyl oligopeptidase family serine peptidase [Solirubrobacterales bacterium]